MKMRKSKLEFQVETAREIRVVDPTIHPTLVGMILYNPSLMVFEYDSICGDYLLHPEDLRKIANYISKLDVDNPRL